MMTGRLSRRCTLPGVSHDRTRQTGGRRSLPDADYPLQDLTGRIIPAFHHVHYTLGYGLLESVYRKALAVELRYRGISVQQLVRYEMVFRGVPVGVYEADLVAEQTVILETKTGLVLDPVAQVQALTYLKASHLPVALVLHFGPRPLVKRIVLSRYCAKSDTVIAEDSVSIRTSAIQERNHDR
jgi:GxxExxY protein